MSVKIFDLNKDKELLEKVIAYEELHSQIKDIEDTTKKIKKEIIAHMNKLDITKARDQIYKLNLSHIKQRRLSEKKLKEELTARGLIEIYNSCLYDSEYDRLTIGKRKGGENIF